MQQKLALVTATQADYGLRPSLAALALSRSTWYYHQREPDRSRAARYADLRAKLEAVILDNPGYGYRRITPELRAQAGTQTNKKVVQELLKLWDFPLLRGTHHPKPGGVRQVIDQAGGKINLVAMLRLSIVGTCTPAKRKPAMSVMLGQTLSSPTGSVLLVITVV